MSVKVSDGHMTYSAIFQRRPSEREIAWAFAHGADYELRPNEVLACFVEYEDGSEWEFGLISRRNEIVPVYLPPYAEVRASRVLNRNGIEVSADECKRIPRPRSVPKVRWM